MIPFSPLTPKEPVLDYVTTAAPLRISFVGGGTDLPVFYERQMGAVLSTAIDKRIYVTVKRMGQLYATSYRLNYSITENVDSIDEIENEIARECLRLVPVKPPLYIGTVADVPASSGLGSSSAAFFWAASKICLSACITSSSALIDFSRPTNNGTIMYGKTTMSRSGRTG